MIDELKIIKNKFGEKMSRYCRDYLSTVLDENGKLLQILLEHFNPSHELYKDLEENDILDDFKNYIYKLAYNNNDIIYKTNKTPEELLSEAGYNLFECKTEDDIQSFKKYYAPGEELCTFYGGRLNSCRVFFAVKKDVDNIRRSDYNNPKRQDKYGTSVISIQFRKDGTNSLSIKNRYNHDVINPDATFSNNLDNIISGLTYSFEKYYNIVQKYKNNNFEIPGYQPHQGKYYKYNCEDNDIYYCSDNIIIDHGNINKYDKLRYIVFDYFVLDMIDKKIIKYDNKIIDSFTDTIGEFDKVRVLKKEYGKEIIISSENKEDIIIKLDKDNNMIGYINNNVETIGDDFLYSNEKLIELKLGKVENIGNDFLSNNTKLTTISLPNAINIGNSFLYKNQILTILSLPNVKNIGNRFLYRNTVLTTLTLPSAINIGDYFLFDNKELTMLSLPNAINIGNNFLYSNTSLTTLTLPNVRNIGDNFLCENQNLTTLSLPNVKNIGNRFLYRNTVLTTLTLPNVANIEYYFLYWNENLITLSLPNIEYIGAHALEFNKNINIYDMLNNKNSEIKKLKKSY